MRHVIALDVGGTGMKAALMGAHGTTPPAGAPPMPPLLHQARRATGRERGPDAVVASILGFAAELRAYGERHFGEPAAAVGVAVPGIVDDEQGTAVYAANLGWRDVPLRALLGERLGGVPVALGHDVRTGGLAEGRIGAGQGADRFLFVPLGTGIAGAIGIGGTVEAGAHGFAGEIGHIVVRPGGVSCSCRQRGCLERYASASAVSEAWAAASGNPEADAADCAKAVDSGDPRAREVWQGAVEALADGLVTALTLLDPRTLIIGGGLAEAGETLFTPLRAAVRHRVTFQKLPSIVPAALGDTAGCLGAGLLAWDLLTTTPTTVGGNHLMATASERDRDPDRDRDRDQDQDRQSPVPERAPHPSHHASRSAPCTVLSGARVVLPTGIADGARVVVEGSRIADGAAGAAEGTQVIDLTGHWVVPGFVDMHNHGGGGASFTSGTADEILHGIHTHRRHGTTTLVASTVTVEMDFLAQRAGLLSELAEQGEIAGVHFEGPFISPCRKGAHSESLLRHPDPAEVRKVIDAARGHARMVTLATELPGGIDSVRLLAEHGVIAAIGHTDATYEQTAEAIDAGATVATHLFNAMPQLGHREPGPVAALLEDERVTVELINDGVHLHPASLELAFRHAGGSRVAFITDAMDAAGFGDGRYRLGPLEVEVSAGVARLVEGGSIAGSTLTLDRAFQRAVTVDRLPVEDVVAAISANPARLLGVYDRVGSLEPGKDADLVVLDAEFGLKGVMRRGEWVVAPETGLPLRPGCP